jgi:hypothetical protein
MGVDGCCGQTVYVKMEEPLSFPYTRCGSQPKLPVMNDYHPTFFLAAVVAIVAALVLRVVGVPAPWPAAIALYVYGTVAWPVMRERMPVKPALYAAMWASVALLVFAYETLNVYRG